MDNETQLVYSTETGRIKPKNFQEKKQNGDGFAKIQLETKGRKGKGVTTISGMNITNDELKNLTRDLKKRCSSGGSLKNDIIEIQGDHRNKVRIHLKQTGFLVK